MTKIMNNSLEYIKNYGYNSIFFKYLKKILVIIIIPFFVLNTALGILYAKNLRNRAENALSESFRKSEVILSGMLEQIENNHIYSSSDKSFELFMIDRGFDPNVRDLKTLENIRNMMIYFKNTNPLIQNIYLRSNMNGYVISTSECGYDNAFKNQDWFLYAKENPDEVMFTVESKTGDDNMYDIVTFCYKIYLYGNEEGLIAFEFNNISLMSKLLSGFNEKNAELYLYYDDKKIYSVPENNSDSADTLIGSATQNVSFKNQNGKYIFYKKLDNSKYSMAVMYSDSIPLPENIILIMLLMIVTAIIISIIMAVYLSGQNYNSITKIMGILYDKSCENKVGTADELSCIIENIQNNLLENNTLERDLSEKITELKKAQLMSVQLQLTPHFLFNTLNHISITIMTITGGNNKASQMISLLSDLLSYTLDTENIFTTVGNEIAEAKKYIEIECIKHNNSFSCIWEFDDMLIDSPTPKLILQPILENAFSHGIKMLNGTKKGEIKISVYSHGNNIIYRVSDNGVGIDRQRLESIRKQLEQHIISGGKHVGLSNVNQKLYLLFGDESRVTLTSDTSGTTVLIKIPNKKA